MECSPASWTITLAARAIPYTSTKPTDCCSPVNSGVQLTWMDAKVGSEVITPRIGKPVEVNALWYNALRTMARFAFALDKPTWDYNRMAERAQAGFARFWNAQKNCCFDVLDGPGGRRLPGGQRREPSGPTRYSRCRWPRARSAPTSVPLLWRFACVGCSLRMACARSIQLTRNITGTIEARLRNATPGAYHQGPCGRGCWVPSVLATHLARPSGPASRPNVYRAHGASCVFFAQALGTANEICEGDPPFPPCGAISQAWSVAEVLRAWHACYEADRAAKRSLATLPEVTAWIFARANSTELRDENFLSFRQRHKKEIYTCMPGSGTSFRVDRLQRKFLTQDFGCAAGVAHIALDLLDALSKTSEEAGQGAIT